MRKALLLGLCGFSIACDDGQGAMDPVVEQDAALDASLDARVDAGRIDGGLPTDIDARTTPESDGSLSYDASEPAPRSSVRVLSYNVAGLPEGISSSSPARNSPLISPLLNGYELALLQEDFAYHPQIVSMATHPFQSMPDMRGQSLGDGLNTLSRFAFSDFTRLAWRMCFGLLDSGSDCLTPKGFTFARVTIDGLSVDVYDVHADAGSAAGDKAARADNLRQLRDTINERSTGRAVIVAGDLNARYTRSGDNVAELVDGAGLTDVWVELLHGGVRPVDGDTVSCSMTDENDPACEHIDKLLYRSGGGTRLRPRNYRVEGDKFVDANGAQLSDHRPISAQFDLFAAQ